ncbi:outer membrane protein [Erythrobacter sp. SG61-1L]|uniref:outer membrane protein n=1 Tax=Erythrobacter sp. SG61-1L TaxID=1603897 RepID=UPI0006C93091
MVKKSLGLGAALIAVATATPALARDGQMYAGVDAGIVIPNDVVFSGDQDVVDGDYAAGFDLGGFVGYDFGVIRVEGEVAYKDMDADETSAGDFGADGNVNVLTGMVNALLELGDGQVSAFAGGGVGYASVNLDVDDTLPYLDDQASGFAWQLLTGMRFRVSKNIDLGIKYRMLQVQDLNFVDAYEDDLHGNLRTHSLMGGITVNFGPSEPPIPSCIGARDGGALEAGDAAAGVPEGPLHRVLRLGSVDDHARGGNGAGYGSDGLWRLHQRADHAGRLCRPLG